MKYFYVILIFTLCMTSCNEKQDNASENKAQKVQQQPEYKKMEFHITGMTCEIGCARLIESKLSKTNGVKFAKVSFTDSLALVEFDSNKLTVKKINTIVNEIAGGDLYKTSNNKTVSW